MYMAVWCGVLFASVQLVEQSTARLPAVGSWEPVKSLHNDYVFTHYPSGSNKPELVSYVVNTTVVSTGRLYTMYVAVLLSSVLSSFSLELPPQGCCQRVKTSDTAKAHNCTYATNAGFFDLNNGCCVGNLITNNRTIQLSTLNRVNFALSMSGYWIGYMSESVVKDLMPEQCISGAGWLVRNGSSYVNKSGEIEGLSMSFVKEKAPRTGLGVSNNGSLLILQVDGEEDKGEGVDLWEFAEIAVGLGLLHFVNLDGGGSSVSVKQGKVIDRPTCLDNTIVCERAVTSITCVRD